MDNRFTPGPWKVKHSESKDSWNVIGTIPGCRYKIARCPYPKSNEPVFEKINKREKDEAKLNAHLIAAAPDMYELLKNLIELPVPDMDALIPDIQSLLKSIDNG